ncbi:MAG: hypothetical protein HOH43_03050 [Candidatus Latescibacteria bacterium]|nr:hypothetical protein [Candidatus Latescibacterota bacterium]
MRCKIFTSLIATVLLASSACYEADRANPLDAGTFDLFVPKIGRPVGGEEMFPGASQEIRWRPAAKIVDSSVKILLICAGDTTVITDEAQNTGTFAWTVPDTPSSSCRIRIIGIGGGSESPGTFRIRKHPIENRIDLASWEAGLEGNGITEPSALRDEIVFTATLGGNTDIWKLDRSNGIGVPDRITFGAGYDGQAVWLKPNGKAIVYTSEDSSGQRDVWIRATEGNFGPQTTRISVGGGEQPSWRNMERSDSFDTPAIAYSRPSLGDLSNLLTVELSFHMASLPSFGLPISVTPTSFFLPLHTGLPEALINRIFWFSTAAENRLLYGSRDPSKIYNVSFSGEAYQTATNSPVGLTPGLLPIHPSVSPDGEFMAFASRDDLWITPKSGVAAWRLTIGSDIDAFPDWASDEEIVFQRKSSIGAPWQLWTVERPTDVP